MTELAYPLPEIGEASLSADPRTLEALINIKAWAQGQIDSTNLKAEGVETGAVKGLAITTPKVAEEAITEAKITAAMRTLLNNKTAGGETKKSIIATEQERTSAAFGTLTTPDEVTVVLPENGLIAIGYQATWWSEVNSAGRAAIFLGANQLKIAPTSAAGPVVQEASFANVGNVHSPLATSSLGLVSQNGAENYTGDVTTGQILAASATTGKGGALCYVFAAAGTYKVSIQFAATSGAVKAKSRKLWALVIA